MDSDNRFAGVIGSDYDLFKLAVPHHDEFQDKVGEVVRQYAEERQKKQLVVLEIGCGHGETTRRLLEIDPRIFVIAVDNNSHMLSVAKRNLSKYWNRACYELSAYQAFRKYRRTVDVVASAYTMHNFASNPRWRIRSEINKCFEGRRGLFVNADKYARTDMLEHWSDLKDQIDAFKVFDDAGRRDLRLAWTKHYLDDEETRVVERDELEGPHWRACSSKEFIYRTGMEAIFCARWG